MVFVWIYEYRYRSSWLSHGPGEPDINLIWCRHILSLVGGLIVPIFVFASDTKLICLSLIWNRNKNPTTFTDVGYHPPPMEMINYNEPRMVNQRRDYL